MASTPGNWRYHVFPSFRGEDVRNSFLSHLLEKLNRKLITTFIDHGIDRSRPIGPELLLAIRESRISIVVFSKNYASSTWCLNELVEIHRCYTDQMVIPIFYHVDPSERFEKTCKGKTDDDKQLWIQALTDAKMAEHIDNDVFNKLMKPSNDFSDLWGLKLESEEVIMVGIVGPSGICKSTIGRALFSQLSSLFHHHAFVSYKSTKQWDDYSMKLCLDERLMSEISCQKDIKISHLSVVRQMLNRKKVLIIVDDVDNIEVINTLVGQTRLVGSGSRIIVITQDSKLLKSQKIELIYEVDFPSYNLAMKMFCRSAFGQNSPPYGFEELAAEVANLSGYLPLGLNVLGSSLKGMKKEEWVDILPRLRNSLGGKIEKTLRVSYDGLYGKDQELFLYIACLFSGHKVNHIKYLLRDSVRIGLRVLADKSLIHITPSDKIVDMHSLLQKLGTEIDRAESINNTGKRRFLREAEDICDNVLAMYLNMSEINEPFFIYENAFRGMRNLKFLKFYKNGWLRGTDEGRLYLPRGIVHFPRKLRLLHWDEYPSKCMPFCFKAEGLVELRMMNSQLEKLWEGTQSLQSLWMMDLSGCETLVEIPDLSMATQLEFLKLKNCKSLVMLPSSIKNLNRLVSLNMDGCTMLELKNFPQISTNIEYLYLDDTGIEEIPSWIEKMSHLKKLRMPRCQKLKNVSLNIFKLKYLEADFSDWKNHNNVDAQELIIQSHSNGAVVPGGEVPMYFTHRACGRSLSILLSESSLSQEYMIVKTCIVVGPSRRKRCDSFWY
ncbi:hypothetical protein Bca4012_088699 [Brassica carinata]